MKRESIEDVMYKGYRIGIYSDNNPQNPREEWDNAGKMVCWHRRYTLGDEQPSEDPEEYLAGLTYQIYPNMERDHSESRDRLERSDLDYKTEYLPAFERMEQAQRTRIEKVLNEHYIMLPLNLYDHGGITMSTGRFNCPWDSGQVGFIYISVKDAIHEWGSKWDKFRGKASKETIDKAVKYLEGEVEIYDDYLTGAVYYYCTEHVLPDGDTGDVIDSCGGYYGYDHEKSGLLEAARDSIDHHIKSCIEAHSKQLKIWIQNKVPLGKRTPLVEILYEGLKAPAGVCI